MLYHLIELEERKLFREVGYGSMFDYCVRKLGYSEGSACKRVNASRALKENPEISKSYLLGKLSLTTISMSYKSIKEGQVSIKEIEGKSKKEVQAPEEVKTLKERVRRVKFKPKTESLSLFDKTRSPVPEPKEAPEHYEVTISLSKEEYEKLEKAKHKLSHTLKGSNSNKAVIMHLVNGALKPRKIKARSGRADTRRIPEPVKREVYERDQGTCTYVSSDGTKCTEKRFLHYDHILPFSLGGKSEASNLRLLCATHNAMCAQEVFGKDYITKKLSAVSYREHATSPGAVKTLQNQGPKSSRVLHLKT